MMGVSSLLRKRSPHKSSARLIDAFLPAATLATTKQAVTRASVQYQELTKQTVHDM
ncbi:hypothetical protein [Microcoleus sp. OTE_8_concoct_300]|uniref:hypothetical protein n=1 Tax=Microcoleus sp. OTE_8_concoct_300 TaxID=2964710 RepID=UPI00403F31E2